MLRHLPALKFHGAPSQVIPHWLAPEQSSVQRLETMRGFVASHPSFRIPFHPRVPRHPFPPVGNTSGLLDAPPLFACFFVKSISLFCMCAFSMHLKGTSIPALSFAINPHCCGCTGRAAPNGCSRPVVAIRSLSLSTNRHSEHPSFARR